MIHSRLQLWMQPQESLGFGPGVGEGREGLARRGQGCAGGCGGDLGAGPLTLHFPEATE